MSKKIEIETAADPDAKAATAAHVPQADAAKGSSPTNEAPDAADDKSRKSSRKHKKPKATKAEGATAEAGDHEDDDAAGETAQTLADEETAQMLVDEETAQVYKERLIRLQADFDNFRRRTQRERSDLYRMANEDLIGELLPVIDYIALALEAAGSNEQSKGMADGVRLVLNQLEGTLKKFNLEPIDAVGQPFDANLHEALSQAPSQEFNDQVVMLQYRRGYKLGSKLLRPAQVVISLGPGPGNAAPAQATVDVAPAAAKES